MQQHSVEEGVASNYNTTVVDQFEKKALDHHHSNRQEKQHSETWQRSLASNHPRRSRDSLKLHITLTNGYNEISPAAATEHKDFVQAAAAVSNTSSLNQDHLTGAITTTPVQGLSEPKYFLIDGGGVGEGLPKNGNRLLPEITSPSGGNLRYKGGIE